MLVYTSIEYDKRLVVQNNCQVSRQTSTPHGVVNTSFVFVHLYESFIPLFADKYQVTHLSCKISSCHVICSYN